MKKPRNTIVTIFVPDGIGKLKSKSVSFVAASCQYFFNAQHQFVRLSKGERAFFDFLCEQMDKKNRVHVIKGLKEKFVEFISKVTNNDTVYTVGSVNKFVVSLSELDLIFKVDADTTRAYYIVNPKYVFKDTETKRKKYLEELIHARQLAGLPIDPLIREPLLDFLNTPTLPKKSPAKAPRKSQKKKLPAEEKRTAAKSKSVPYPVDNFPPSVLKPDPVPYNGKFPEDEDNCLIS